VYRTKSWKSVYQQGCVCALLTIYIFGVIVSGLGVVPARDIRLILTRGPGLSDDQKGNYISDARVHLYFGIGTDFEHVILTSSRRELVGGVV
jgi:hypothetical protein